MEGSPEQIATQLVEMGPEQLITVLAGVDEKLQEMGASLQAVVDQIGGGEQQQGQAQQQGDSMMDAGVVDGGQVPWGGSAPEMPTAPGSRQRLTIR